MPAHRLENGSSTPNAPSISNTPLTNTRDACVETGKNRGMIAKKKAGETKCATPALKKIAAIGKVRQGIDDNILGA